MPITEIFTTATYDSDGIQLVAWPSGMTAGTPAAMLVAPGSDGKPKAVVPATWLLKATKSDGTKLYVNPSPTSTEVASPIPVVGRLVMLRAFPGAAGFGKVGTGESLALSVDGSALSLWGWKSTSDTLTVSNKTDPTDVANESYVYGGNTRKYNTWSTVLPTAGPAYIDTNAGAFFALEVLPKTVPNAPTILTPPDGVFVDYGSVIPVSWIYNGAGKQYVARVRYRVLGTSTWYLPVEPSMFWMQEETYKDWSNYTLRWANDTTYEWAIATSASSTLQSEFSASRTITFRSKPTLTASISGSGLARTVSWAATITNGVQEWFRVRVTLATEVSAENAIYDSGIVAGAEASLALPADIGWVNGGDYKAWVEIGQTGGQQTAPTSSASFNVSWTPPPTPTVSVQISARPLRITVSGLTADHHRVRLSFTAGGVSRAMTQMAVAGSVSFDVPLAPYATPTTYTVAASQLVSGVELWSESTSRTTASTDTSTYLVDGDDWISAVIYDDEDRVDSEGISVSYGLGATRPTVVRTPSAGEAGKTTFICRSRAAMDAMSGWLRDHTSFDVRWPPERDRSGALIDVPAMRISRTTPRSTDRLAPGTNLQHRLIPVSWVQQ